MSLSVSVAPVLVAALVAFVIGFLWHGPLFGNQWIKLMQIPQSEVDAMRAKGMGPMIPTMIIAYLQQCVVALVMSHLTSSLGLSGAIQSVSFAVLVWLGFVATVLLNGVLWEKRSVSLYLFNIVYQLAVFVAIALVVVLWK